MSIARHFDRLSTLRDDYERKLLLHEARHSFDDADFEDGTGAELRARIAELTEELSALLSKHEV